MKAIATQLYGSSQLQLSTNVFIYSVVKYLQAPSTATTQHSRMKYSCRSASKCTGAVKFLKKKKEKKKKEKKRKERKVRFKATREHVKGDDHFQV